MKASRAARLVVGSTLVLTAAACGDDGGGPMAPPTPVIDNIDIQGSVRAGEVVVITGRNLSGSSAALQLAASVEILLDGRVLAPESVSATEVRVRIPLDVSPGPHTLSVRVDGRTSNSVQFTVEVFTVTGTYQGPGRIASATCNDPAVQAELQQLFPPGATGEGIQAVRDERPDLTMISLNFSETAVISAFGTLNADGTFRVVVEDTDPEIVSEKTGRFTAVGSEVTLESTNTITLETGGLVCVVEIEFTEQRVSTQFQPPSLSTGATGASIAEALPSLVE